MSRSALEYIRHILDEAEYLLEQREGLHFEEFRHDPTLQRAFVRSLEIIGEAAKQVPEPFKQRYPQVEWRAMIAMRNRLIHGYFGVDYTIVWDVIINKIPEVAAQMRMILQQEEGRAD